MSLLNTKFNNNVNIPSDKPKTKQKKFINHQKTYATSPLKGLVTIIQKRTKTVK